MIVVLVGIRIVCDVVIIGDSLTGRASRYDGATRAFSGWLGLLGALQDLVADPDTDRDADGEPWRASGPDSGAADLPANPDVRDSK